jgi:hypothetical protein
MRYVIKRGIKYWAGREARGMVWTWSPVLAQEYIDEPTANEAAMRVSNQTGFERRALDVVPSPIRQEGGVGDPPHPPDREGGGG